MLTGKEIAQKVKEQKTLKSDLYTRQDEEFNHWALRETEFDKHPNAINITLPDPRNFADKLQRNFISAERRITIRTLEEVGREWENLGKLEQLFDFLLEKADERLWNQLLPSLRSSLIWCALVRGWMAARILTQKVKGKGVIPNYMAWDPRWVTYEVGKDGLLWGNYETFRSKAIVLDEYGYKISSPWYKFWEDKKEIIVLDYYDDIFNYIVIEDEIVKQQKHNMGSIPILIAPVATRPPIVSGTQTELKGYGESIFAAGKGTDKLNNQLASIWATQANRISKEVMIHERGEGAPLIESIWDVAGGVINVPMGKSAIHPIGTKEVSPTLVNLFGIMDIKRQHSTLPNIDMGQFERPPQSGIAISLTKQEGTVVGLVLDTMNLFYSQICMMIEKQLLHKKLAVNVVGEQDRKFYAQEVTPIDLKKPHTIRVEFVARTPWQETETLQRGLMARDAGIPQEFIDEHIYRLQDPILMRKKRAMEIYQRSPDAIRLDAIEQLEREGRGDEADDLREQIAKEHIKEHITEEMPRQQEGVETPPTPTGTPVSLETSLETLPPEIGGV